MGGAGEPIGVMSGNSGSLSMCEVLPSSDGGVSLYFNLTPLSSILCFSAQGAPRNWVEKIQAPEFRESLFEPVDQPGKRSWAPKEGHDSETMNLNVPIPLATRTESCLAVSDIDGLM